MSVTAFPVLARILTDRGHPEDPLGVIALACAAVDDVTAWCLLAFVVAVAQAKPSAAARHRRARRALHRRSCSSWPGPLVARAVRAPGTPRRSVSQGAMAVVFVGAPALDAGHRGGRHPRHLRRLPARRDHPARLAPRPGADPQARRPRGGPVPAGLLRLHRDADRDRPGPRWRAVAALRAHHRDGSIGKFGGSLRRRAAHRARQRAMRPRSAMLMNTRGLMELIVLNIGLDLHSSRRRSSRCW